MYQHNLPMTGVGLTLFGHMIGASEQVSFGMLAVVVGVALLAAVRRPRSARIHRAD